MWLIPGRTLTLFGWVGEFVQLPGSQVTIPGQTFVDPFISRLFGAALLALAFSSFLGWKAKRWEQVAIVAFVEQATMGLRQAIHSTHREISLLRELRTRLIADVVTGLAAVPLDIRSLSETSPCRRE